MNRLRFDEKGLIPTVVQDLKTKKVLMMAYMNEESIQKTMETGTTWFYSRSREELWNKGGTSGNTQFVKKMYSDCDGDTLLIEVEQIGVACHTGNYSCFFTQMYDKMDDTDVKNDIIDSLIDKIKERKTSDVEDSYTKYLFNKGIDKVLKKVGEEAAEVIIAAKNPEKDELIYELSDLVYHALVLMEIKEVTLGDIKAELTKRYK